MADSDWEDIDPKKVNHDSQWEDLPNFESALSPGTGVDFGSHAVNGALLGGSSKAAGAIASPIGALKASQQYVGYLPFIGEPAKDSDPDIKEYLKAKFARQESLDSSKKRSPFASASGEVVGSAVPAVAQGALLPVSGAGGAAILGAEQGLIQSSPESAAKDIAIGAGIGAGSYLGMNSIVNNSAKVGKNILKKGLNVFADTPEALTEGYLNNPDAYNNALPKEGVAQKLADTLGDVKEQTGPLAEVAQSKLSTERIPRNGFETKKAIEMLRSVEDKKAAELARKLEEELLQSHSPAAISNVHQMPSQINDPNLGSLTASGETVPATQSITAGNNQSYLSESELHEVKKALQDAADWRSPLPSSDIAKARSMSGSINQTLKSGNPEYADAMSSLSQNIQSKNQLAQKFGIQNDFSGNNESGYTFSDRTLGALKDIVRGNKVDRARVLESLKEQGYGDLADDVEKSLGKSYFEGVGRPNGSRKAVIGTGIGAAAGHFTGVPGAAYIGGAIGGAVGGTVDKYSPQVAKKVLDGANIIQKLASSPIGKKFASVIQAAASRGASSLAATHFLLQQTEPEYQKAVQGE